MSTCVRADGTVFVQYVAGGKKHRKYFGKSPDALSKARDFDLTRERPTEARAGPTFSDLATAYVSAKQHQMTPSTYRSLWYKLSYAVLPALGTHYATALTPTIIDKYVSKRLQSVKSATARGDITFVIAILRFAVQRNLIAANPLAGYVKPRLDCAIVMPISAEQLTRLVGVSPEHLRRSILLSYYLGLRPGATELFALKWSAVDWTAGTITVTSARKGGISRREIPISQGLPLRDWWEMDGRPVESTIITFRGKSIASVYSSWQTAKRAAGIGGKVPLYAIRHSFISSLLHAGVDPQTISGISGHSVSTLLTHYAHYSSASKLAAIGSLHLLGADSGGGVAEKSEGI